jgi:deoxycytidylate deaminase
MSTVGKHTKYFDMLEKMALALEPVARQRVAALLVYKNEVISVGYNKKKSHPFQRQFAKHEEAIFLHAEVDCIKNALKSSDEAVISKSTMYVLRVKHPENNHRKFVRGMSKPCAGCQRAIAQFDIKNVFYTTDDGFDYL